MKHKKPPGGGDLEDTGSIPIDFASLLTKDVTSSGSFYVKGIQATSLGKLLQALPIPALLISQQQRIMFANEACGRINSSYEKVLGEPIFTLCPLPTEASEFKRVMEEVFSTRKPQSYQALLGIGKNRIWGRMHLRSLRLAEERLVLLLIEDLTVEKRQLLLMRKQRDELTKEIIERREAENALRETQQRFELALTGADLGWWEWNVQTGQTIADGWGAEAIGYSSDAFESYSRPWEEFIHPDDKPGSAEALNKHLQGYTALFETEHRLRIKTGEWKWILVRGKIIEYDSEGKPLRMGGTYLDITDRKIAEEAVRESEKRFRAIFEGAGDPIFLKDRSLKYTQANPAFEKLVGLPASEIMGKKYEHLFGEDPSNYIMDIDRRVLSGETIEAERSTTIRGEPMRFVATRTPLRDASGEIVGILTMLHDISDRKHGQVSPILAGEKYRSEAMRSTINLASVAAEKESIVLLRGESGCGKDYLARYIHDNSKRSDGPYFCVNCAAIAPELAESELFGHEKGSFTGAVTQKRGLLELAEGGTLLLNEIGDLSLPLQAKLLTFLDTRKFTRVGGEKEITANARLMVATNKDLEREVEAGRFREDLFYRINVISINVPPLRERVDDIPMLVEEILSELQKEMQFHTLPSIDPTTMEMLKSYHWPGNVRELRNTLERSVILSDGGTIDLTCLQLSMDRGSQNKDWSFTTSFPLGGTLQDVTDELTRCMLVEAFRLSGGNKKKAAQTLGISRDTLYRHMKKFGMEMGD